MASLRERLLGRSTPNLTPKSNAGQNGTHPTSEPPNATSIVDGNASTIPQPAPAASTLPTLPTSRTAGITSRTGHTFAPRLETAALSPGDQLKVDLHRRLIDRLDLEALERVKDEHVLIQQIGNAVVEFLRTESTPRSQTEREEVIEQIVYGVTGLGPI